MDKGNIVVGCGKADPNTGLGDVIPIQTWMAQPGLTTQIYPKNKYFVCFGEAQPGTIVKRSLLGNVLQVDYTNCSVPDGKFVLNSHGKYEADPSVRENGIGWNYGPLKDEDVPA